MNNNPNGASGTLSSPLIHMDQWVKNLSEFDLPAFQRTVRQVSAMALGGSGSASELSKAVLNDPGFTVKIIKSANSVLHNPLGRNVHTVTRAVVLLGFDTIRSICLAIPTMESRIKGKFQDQVDREIVQAVHASVQARNIAIRKKLEDPEEIHVAAALLRIGPLALWCRGGDWEYTLEKKLNAVADRQQFLEKHVLGFSMQQLSMQICKDWNLSALTAKSIANSNRSNHDPRVSAVCLGHDIADIVKLGWQDPSVNRGLEKIAVDLNEKPRDLLELVRKSTAESYDILEKYGGRALSRLLVEPENKAAQKNRDSQVKWQEDSEAVKKILSEIYQATRGPFEINDVLDLINQGLIQGLAMDRGFFAVYFPGDSRLLAKHGVGWERGGNMTFRVPPDPGQSDDPLIGAIYRRQPAWVRDPVRFDNDMNNLANAGGYYLAPVVVEEKVMGVIYADRLESVYPLCHVGFEQFLRFAQAASEAFARLQHNHRQ